MARAAHRRSFLILGLGIAALGLTIGAVVDLHGRASTTQSGSTALDSNGLPTTPITYTYIKGRPDAQVVYPGARLLHHMGGGEAPADMDGVPSSAFVGGVYITADSQDKVYAWYDQQLRSQGYAPYDVGGSNTTSSNKGWERGPREAFVVGIDIPSALGGILGQSIPSGGTVFETRYWIDPPPTSTPAVVKP